MTVKVKLTYNPFLEKGKSVLEINGEECTDVKYKKYLDQNLQVWIDNLFAELYETYAQKEFEFSFKGLESDWLDVEECIEKANQKGFKITTAQIEIVKKTATERLAELEKLLVEMKKNPLFAEKMKNHNDFNILEENIFDILVVATMSSGKSTFINSLLGCDLLPAKNEATTAGITEIYHDASIPYGHFYASRQNKNEIFLERDVFLDLTKPDSAKDAAERIKEWNTDIDNKEKQPEERTHTILLKGNFIGIKHKNNIKIRFNDTPGPNNSNEKNHSKITLGKIKDSTNNPLILYILDSSKLSVNDDRLLLKGITEQIEKQGLLAENRFLFLANRMDEYFNPKEEIISDTLERVKTYLKEHGILNPKIYPISAKLAKLLRLHKDLLDEDELEYLTKRINKYNENDLNQYMLLNDSTRKELNRLEDCALKRSGIPAVEIVISQYIEKYAEPYRIMHINKAISNLLEETKSELELDNFLNNSKQSRDTLLKELTQTEKKRAISDTIKNKIEEMKKDETSLVNETIQSVTNKHNEINRLVANTKQKLAGEILYDDAIKELKSLSNKVNDIILDLITDMEIRNDKIQEEQKKLLSNAYNKFLSEYFNNYPIPDAIKKNISFKMEYALGYFDFQKIKKKTRKREWWNIVEFFFPKELAEGVENHLYKLDCDLSIMIKEITEEIKQNAKNITQQYGDRLQDSFDEELNKIQSKIEENENKLTELKTSIEDANNKLIMLDKYKNHANTNITL